MKVFPHYQTPFFEPRVPVSYSASIASVMRCFQSEIDPLINILERKKIQDQYEAELALKYINTFYIELESNDVSDEEKISQMQIVLCLRSYVSKSCCSQEIKENTVQAVQDIFQLSCKYSNPESVRVFPLSVHLAALQICLHFYTSLKSEGWLFCISEIINHHEMCVDDQFDWLREISDFDLKSTQANLFLHLIHMEHVKPMVKACAFEMLQKELNGKSLWLIQKKSILVQLPFACEYQEISEDLRVASAKFLFAIVTGRHSPLFLRRAAIEGLCAWMHESKLDSELKTSINDFLCSQYDTGHPAIKSDIESMYFDVE